MTCRYHRRNVRIANRAPNMTPRVASRHPGFTAPHPCDAAYRLDGPRDERYQRQPHDHRVERGEYGDPNGVGIPQRLLPEQRPHPEVQGLTDEGQDEQPPPPDTRSSRRPAPVTAPRDRQQRSATVPTCRARNRRGGSARRPAVKPRNIPGSGSRNPTPTITARMMRSGDASNGRI